MPTKKPNQIDFNKQHTKRVEQYASKVKQAYNQVVLQVSKLAVPLTLNAKDEFYFAANPSVNKKVNSLLDTMYNDVYSTTINGGQFEWDKATENNNAIAQAIYGKDLAKLPKQYQRKYLSNNEDARKSFFNRKQADGLGLSDKVWNNTKQFKQELELTLEASIGNGRSSAAIAKDITKYLNDPDQLFRRIRDKETGALRLSKAAKVYNPGQGRYRSSFKNANRLARNEINFSYEQSNYLKRQQQDFVVGTQIKVSPSHRASDDAGGISCFSLQGMYPKEFDFTYKWHVNCKCMSLSILKTPEELSQDLDKILSGDKPDTASVNAVNNMPGNFTQYIGDNQSKWSKWATQPRFMTANKTILSKPIVTDLNTLQKKYIDFTNVKGADVPAYANVDKEVQAVRDFYKSNEPNQKLLSDSVADSINAYKWGVDGQQQYKNIRRRLSDETNVYLENTNTRNKVDTIINDLTGYIKQNPIKQDAKLVRMVSTAETSIFKSKNIGDTFTDMSFASCSVVPQRSFGSYQIDILVDAGSEVAHMINNTELEFLIQRGSSFVVLEQSENRMLVQLLNKK